MQKLPPDTGSADRYRPALLIGAIYDLALGIGFLFFTGPLFALLGIALEADPVYVQLTAGLIAIMGFGFFLAWRQPLLNGDIVLMGAVFKAIYVALAVYTLVRGELPHMVFLVLAVIDLVFLVVFLAFLRDTSEARAAIGRAVPGRTAP